MQHWSGNVLQKLQCKKCHIFATKRLETSSLLHFDVIEYGEEGQTIVSFAEKNNYDMIVVGSRGMGIVKESFLGSTSSHVVHDAKIPVLVVK